MELGTSLRGFRAPLIAVTCAAVALTPAVADAAAKKPAKKHAAAKEANGKKPAAKPQAVGRRQQVGAPAPASADGLGNRFGQGPTMQLAAMSTAINAAPAYFAGRDTHCTAVTPLLAQQPGDVMA